VKLMRAETDEPIVPTVRLGHLADDSIAASVYVLVCHGVALRPRLAMSMQASVVLRFPDGYSAVRIDFRGDEIEVGDDPDSQDRASDLEITGRLGDVNALIAAPLAGGLPKPTTPRGRAAIGRLADGRVEFDGPLRLARKLLKLLAVDTSNRRSRKREVEVMEDEFTS
jgi:hypothetical protein